MSIRFNHGVRNKILEQYRTEFSNGQLRMYSSTIPLSPNDPVSGVLLAVFELPDVPFTPPEEGSMDKDGVWVGEIIASGTAGWFRLFSQDFESWIDGTLTTTGGGGDIELDSVSFTTGNVAIVTTINFTQPEE